MKKTLLLFGFIAMLSSCNSGRIAELEAENKELRGTIEMLQVEAELAQEAAEQAVALAHAQEIIAVEQYRKAQELAESVNK